MSLNQGRPVQVSYNTSLPPLNNHGNYIVSLSKLTNWLGKLVEESGIDIFPGFAGTEILYEGNRVIGVRTGEKGIAPDANRNANFEPGIDLHAKVTVFGEGSRENLTKGLIKKLVTVQPLRHKGTKKGYE